MPDEIIERDDGLVIRVEKQPDGSEKYYDNATGRQFGYGSPIRRLTELDWEWVPSHPGSKTGSIRIKE